MHRRLTSALLLMIVLCVGHAPLQAQQRVAQGGEAASVQAEERGELTRARRQELYEEAALSPAVGVRRSLLLPGLGNLYADRVFKGMLLMGGAGMSLLLFTGGVLRRDRTFMIAGGGAFVGFYTTAAITSYFDVMAYNEQLKLRYKVALVPVVSPEPGGASLGVALRF